MPSLLISEYSAYASRHESQTRRWPLSSCRSLLLSAPRCANAANSLNFWWSSSRSLLFIVCFVGASLPLGSYATFRVLDKNDAVYCRPARAAVRLSISIPDRENRTTPAFGATFRSDL